MIKKLMEIKKELEKNGIMIPVEMNLKMTKTGISMNLELPFKKIGEIGVIQELREEAKKEKGLPDQKE